MEQLLEEKAANADPDNSDLDKVIVRCRLRKFTLPASESMHLLYLLAKVDITPSTIYPGYKSIVEDLRMRNAFARAGFF